MWVWCSHLGVVTCGKGHGRSCGVEGCGVVWGVGAGQGGAGRGGAASQARLAGRAVRAQRNRAGAHRGWRVRQRGSAGGFQRVLCDYKAEKSLLICNER